MRLWIKMHLRVIVGVVTFLLLTRWKFAIRSFSISEILPPLITLNQIITLSFLILFVNCLCRGGDTIFLDPLHR
ncbi:MP2 [Nootka lupine vein clearing virus]|uniref:MP2 n=1 Tax=Nootka lupine vein clearing virus TaxID=283876 RepID=A2TJT1_9TOMB|nr:MP2 [Nootka lupine vein clearing virus]ABM92362.1 MP2 [Nootka lupine vein clearing virus]